MQHQLAAGSDSMDSETHSGLQSGLPCCKPCLGGICKLRKALKHDANLEAVPLDGAALNILCGRLSMLCYYLALAVDLAPGKGAEAPHGAGAPQV
jgi:hypothetical protein